MNQRERETAQKNSQTVCLCYGSPRTFFRNGKMGTSLVVQWLRIHLPMQGTRVRSLIWEDPICRGATKPVSHSY